MKPSVWLKRILLFQGIYYIITGIWPILHIPSFIAVTGDKTDIWLVKMVGALAATIGIYLIYSIRNYPARLLAILSAISFGTVDVYYVYQDVILPIYLSDAVVEAILLILLLIIKK
ncbi:hypothetical protein [Longitalea luteola]|uniref:hypothetical protein n=1 Tax=Longitalea luteola TaxID=2812563 RepID=UPI001A97AEC7|nr:hypothetical protein [Longitalea luteola]